MPALRSAYIERFEGSPDSVTLYRFAEYLDETMPERSRYRQARRRDVLRALIRWDYDTLALPEPFWIAQLPFTTVLAVVARARALLTGRRLAIVTYAIENAETARLLGLPESWPVQLRRVLLSLVVLPYFCTLDRIAFGTSGAQRNYVEGLGRALSRRIRRRSRTFEPLAPACPCMAGQEKIPHSALFLGPLETRKGLDTLLRIWPDVIEAVPSATLVVCGSGPLHHDVESAVGQWPNVRYVQSASRQEMHGLLARADVLVSLPRPSRRWREQIGLSITEGLSHGCHIVTTDQTGLASWLEAHDQSVVPAENADAARRALSRATHDRLAGASAALPSDGGRAVAERWMRGDGR